jgi:PAS domain S-box-containing protein
MIRKLIALWFVLSLSLIAVTEWVAYRNMVMLVESGQVVDHALKILSDINELESQILEAETARRGFVITGKPWHLNRFNGATQKMQDLMVQLRSHTPYDPIQQNRLEHLAPLINKKIDNLNQSIRLRRQKGFSLDEQIAMTDAGKTILDNIHQVLDDLAKTEKQQLSQSYVQRTTSAQRSLLGLALGTLLCFGLLSLVFWRLNREVSGRMKAEASLQRANRTLKTLIGVNQAMVRAVDEGGLLQEICRILVADGGYPLAWVGLAVPDQEKTVRPLASCGVEQGLLQSGAFQCADDLQGQCPVKVAVDTELPCIIRTMWNEPGILPCQSEALRRGFASVCAFPLHIDGQPWGVLAIYGNAPDAFDAEEVKLLGELARDLEYGLGVLRDRAEHQRAEKALEESEAQYRLLVDNLNHGLAILNPQWVFTFANPRLCEMVGYSRNELVGHQVFDFFDPANQEILREQIARRERGERTPYEIEWTRKDGNKINTLITPIPIFDKAGRLQEDLAVITDITDRKQAEARAFEHLQSLNLLIAGVEKLAKLRDPDVMAQEICQLVVDAFDSRLVWLGLVENQGRLRPLNWAGESADCLKELEMGLEDPTLDQGPVGRAIDTGKPRFINELGAEERETPWVDAALARGYQALAAFPLMRGHQAFACLNIYSDRPNFFTPERLDLLQAFAGIAAAAVENAHLNAKVEKHLKQLQALRQIDRAISGSLDLRITLDVLLDQLTTQLGVDAATVMLLNSHTLALECAAARGFRSDALSRAQVPMGKDYAGAIVLARKPLYIPDLAAVQEKYARHQLFASEGFVSYYGLPLLNKGQIRGVIEICHRTRFDADADRVGVLESLAGQAAIAIDNASLFDEMERSHLELTLAYEATLEGWARALELRDFETKGHSQRVTDLTIKLARALGVDDKDLTQIYRGALLHDIGKIAVPDKILLKPGPLTPEEWVIMRQHPIYAYELLSPIAYLRPALDIPFGHHERWDGGGYPRGLKGADIPLAARIFAVVDVWDALGNDRPYRSAWTPDKIRAYLQEQSGTQFDPEVVEVFLEKILDQADTAA